MSYVSMNIISIRYPNLYLINFRAKLKKIIISLEDTKYDLCFKKEVIDEILSCAVTDLSGDKGDLVIFGGQFNCVGASAWLELAAIISEEYQGSDVIACYHNDDDGNLISDFFRYGFPMVSDVGKGTNTCVAPTIDYEKCNNCGNCLDVCDTGYCIYKTDFVSKDETIIASKICISDDADVFCNACGNCRDYCPQYAITIKRVKDGEKT